MMKKLLLFTAFCIIGTFSMAQNGYWQQEVNYKINVTLNDKDHELDAFVEMEYINNSPDYLSEIYIHLWPNAYKNGSTALAQQMVENGNTKLYYASEEDRGYIDSLSFEINGQPVQFKNHKGHIDIARIELPKVLAPGEKMIITTPFHVKLPKGVFSRLGHLGQSYQITQWYPKPAVYDENGWHPMPYLNQGEFYSEFGSFDVSITLPKNYVLGATGDLYDSDEELIWLNELAEATAKRDDFGSDMSFPPSSVETKTLHYKQSRIHDFAWFADKRYHVLKGEVELPQSGRKVTTWAMFTNNEAELWRNSIEYLNDATYYYSLWVGDYPYNHVTAVDGALSTGGGMEYPNITVIGESGNKILLEQTIMHEVGHNWFYGIFGTNERQHPWMDEGMNTFIEIRYMEKKYPRLKLGDMFGLPDPLTKYFDLDEFDSRHLNRLGYLFNARQNQDQPIEYPAHKYTPANYFGVVYAKTGLVMHWLMNYLGEEQMNEVMHTYFNEWKFKHPQPEDFQNVAQEVTGKDLDWFFEDVITTTKKVDYKIGRVKKLEDNSFKITVKNKGDINGPFSISAIVDSLPVETKWYHGFDDKKTVSFPEGEYQAFQIDHHNHIPEIDKSNNWKSNRGLKSRIEPLEVKFLGTIEKPHRTQVFWSPALGWNNYNKFMLGAAVYNNFFPVRNTDYLLMPMYGFGNKKLAGHFDAGYTFYPRQTFLRNVRFGVSGSRYGYSNDFGGLNYNVIKPEIKFDVEKLDARDPVTQSFRLRRVMVRKEVPVFDNENGEYFTQNSDYAVHDFTQTIASDRTLNPYSLSLNIQNGKGFTKASVTGKYQISFRGKNKGIDVRLFAGNFFVKENAGRYRFRMSGWRGFQDYNYDYTFLGRNETSGILSQQFAEEDGAFKVQTPIGQTSDWLIALNIKTSIHRKIPVKLFADIGTYKNAGSAFPGSNAIMYDAGVMLQVIPNVLEVYFPVFMSEDIRNSVDLSTDNYWQTVRYTFYFNRLNPLEKIRNFDF